MKTYHKLLLIPALFIYAINAHAQDKHAEAEAIIRQGTALHDAHKYDEAIAKYDEALKVDPGNTIATYEKAFTTYASGKPKEALVILEKEVVTDKSPRVYALMGNIYDESKEYDKAVNTYLKGIEADPKDANLRYNLSVSYLIQKKYAEAEAAATEAIKLNPKHSSSQRTYAIATYNEGKHINSLLAWCNFLIMEPQSPRAVEACKYLKHILYFNVKGNNMTMGGTDDLTRQQQMSIALGVQGGLAIANKAASDKGTAVTPLDSLATPLQFVFKLAAEKKDPANSVFFNKYYAQFFGDLAKTEYLGEYFHYITLSVFRNEDIDYLKAHQDNLKALNTWVNTYKRETE